MLQLGDEGLVRLAHHDECQQLKRTYIESFNGSRFKRLASALCLVSPAYLDLG